MKRRADLGFGEALEELSGFDKGNTALRNPPLKADFLDAAKASGFGSRQVAEANDTLVQRSRRRRTGRNAQLNIKARPETIQEFCRIADQNGWGLGETLEHAVVLLGKRGRRDDE